MTDLAVLVPSRGRPANVARLIEACEKTCRANTSLHFGFDEDDLLIDAVTKACEAEDESMRASWHKAPRLGLVAWTNKLAKMNLDAPYLASIGDDMVPVTDGWDEALITAIEHMGGGYAYPEDRRRNDIPEAVVVSTSIVKALGWMGLPVLDHWYVDNVWADLGKGAGRLQYCPDVIVEHHHPNVDPATRSDATYHEAAKRFDADAAAYRKWRLYDMPRDIATVKEAVGA